MPELFERFNSNRQPTSDRFDIRTRILISLIVAATGIYLSATGPLLVMVVATSLYVLATRRYKVIFMTYVGITCMIAVSMAIILISFKLAEIAFDGTPTAQTVAIFKQVLVDNYHTPFIRMIPSVNVMLAISLNFQVQRFVNAMKSVRFPRVIFLPLTVFCRFIPEFVLNIRQLRDAVMMRGFALTIQFAVLHPIQTLRLTAIPLSMRTLRMADNLAMAAEMKRIGYTRQPTHYNELYFSKFDFGMLALTLIIATSAILWQNTYPKGVGYGPGGMMSMKPPVAAQQTPEATPKTGENQ